MWSAIWIIWMATFGVVEGIALIRPGRGDTLSENVWRWFKTGPGHTVGIGWGWRAFALGAFLVWLALHLVFGWFAG